MGSLMNSIASSIRFATVGSMVLFALCTGVFSVVHPVSAQDVSTSTETATSTRSSQEAPGQRSEAGTTTENERGTERVATRTDAFREAFQEKQEEFRDQRAIISQAIRDRLHNLFDNIMRRMHAAVDRLDDITDRMESRAQKISEDNGVDVSEATQSIHEARRELAGARETLRSLPEQARAAFGSEHPRERFSAVRVAVRNVGTHIRSAHQTLREAVDALKRAIDDASRTTSEGEDETDTRDLIAE